MRRLAAAGLLVAACAAPAGAQALVSVKVYLIALDDNGRRGTMIGCGDSVVAVSRVVSGATPPLPAALRDLLSVGAEAYADAGLRNALADQPLRVLAATVREGTAHVELTGELRLGGACDGPRVQAQLVETARQFPGVRRVVVRVGGVPLERLLGGPGD